MVTEQRLTKRDERFLDTPEEVVAVASQQATILMDIVNKTHCYQTISGKKYLQVEAWETIGAFNRVHAVTRQTLPIIRDGEVVGYQADVELLRDGIIVGGASMPCFFTENACKGKEGDAKHKACMSAAQTFATSKAYRMNYSYVAILAGYQATPAEEMTGEVSDDRPANLEHWCEEHKTKFFKRGKMPGYAHKIEGTEEWCNEEKPVHTVQQVAKEMAETPTSTPEKSTAEKDKDSVTLETGAPVPAEPEAELDFNPEWLFETLKKIRWTEKTTKDYLKNVLKSPLPRATSSVTEMVVALSREECEDFFKKISDLADIA